MSELELVEPHYEIPDDIDELEEDMTKDEDTLISELRFQELQAIEEDEYRMRVYGVNQMFKVRV